MTTQRDRRGRGGRPSLGDRVLVQARLPREKAERLFALAQEAGQYRSEYVGAILLGHLDRLDREARATGE
jgi:hypothetical protein